MKLDRSVRLLQRAERVIPGGVNSPVRSFRAVEDSPPFIARGEGPYLYDVDGNRFIDYVLSWGPLVLGHAHPEVAGALKDAVDRGTSYGAPTELEVKMAEKIVGMVPSVEVIRMVNSGTEATMSALRLARGFTGRDKIIKFDGCYHGHVDSLLVQAGSGATTLGMPDSPGVSKAVAATTITAPFNDIEAVRTIFAEEGEEIAAVILEPVAGNMGVIPPVPGFLEGLREITTAHGALLIFDEVMTGFRVALGGAQELYGVTPDLTCLGKVIGGGLPVGAYGGRRDLMEQVSPSGAVYQAGTLSGNPLAMTAGYVTLDIISREGVFDSIVERATALSEGIKNNLAKLGLDLPMAQVGTMFGFFFAGSPVRNYQEAMGSDTKRFAAYFSEMLKRGIYLAPSQFEAGFMSSAHRVDDVEDTVRANFEALKSIL